MIIKCPYCDTKMESEQELRTGQHIVCPTCGVKFTYGDEIDRPSFLEAKIWSFIESGDWPVWMRKANEIVVKTISYLTAAAGISACIVWMVTLARADAPVSEIFKPWLILVAMLASIQLSSRALNLVCQLMAGCEKLVIRPQLAAILKNAGCIGFLVFGGWLLFGDLTRDRVIVGIVAVIFGGLWGVCLERLSILRMETGAPANCVEEFVALCVLPLRFGLVVLPLTMVIVLSEGMVYAFVVFGENGVLKALTLSCLTISSLVVPVVAYVNYVVSCALLAVMRAEVSTPSKLVALCEAVSSRKADANAPQFA